jgi:hypothetical protein
MVFPKKRKRENSPTLSIELIHALQPFCENKRMSKIIDKLEKIAQWEKKNGEPIITSHSEVVSFIYLLVQNIEGMTHTNSKAELLRTLARRCLETITSELNKKPVARIQ